MSVTLIVARAENNVIGNKGEIPWRVPADFAHFKATTIGHPLIMGRKTFESIGKPLPGRTTVVVTRGESPHPDVLVAKNLDDALELVRPANDEVFIAGGEMIYEDALYSGVVDKMLVSQIPGSPNGDRHFKFDENDWTQTVSEPRDGFTLQTFVPSLRSKMVTAILSAAHYTDSVDGDTYIEAYAGKVADSLIEAGLVQP